MTTLYSYHRESFPSIASIIPVYNEAQGLQRVLDVVCKVAVLQEIIVVDDGSSDRSVEVAAHAQECNDRIRLITHNKNRGKGQAVFSGLCSTSAELIVTLDADLRGLTVQHIQDLVLPLVADQMDMTIGIFRGGIFMTDFSHWATPWLSGQRCLWRKHLERICWKAAEGYGLETAITLAGMRNRWRIKKVIWWGVSHPPSEVHRGMISGLFNRAKMYTQIARAFIIAGLDNNPKKVKTS